MRQQIGARSVQHMTEQYLRFQRRDTRLKIERLYQSVARRTERSAKRGWNHATGSAKAASRSA